MVRIRCQQHHHPLLLLLPVYLWLARILPVVTSTSLATPLVDEASPLPHPDLNDDNHEEMVFIGRLCDRTGRRLSADHDNTIRYVFGTSFVEESRNSSRNNLTNENDTPSTTTGTTGSSTDELDATHWSTVIDAAALVHHPTGDVPGSSGHDPHDPRYHRSFQHTGKTREQVLQERQTQPHASQQHQQQQQQPIPFGHVETHPLDGGVVPVVAVAVEPFWMDETPVTNQAFAQFVRATYYETEAELYGWSFVLSSFLPADAADYMTWETDPDAPHWVAVVNATWRQPEGPLGNTNSNTNNPSNNNGPSATVPRQRALHPVVHVSHRDAAEYCTWRGKRLPGEREYEAVTRASHWSSSTTRSTSHTTRPTINVDAEHAIHGRTMYAWGNFIHSNDTSTGTTTNTQTATTADHTSSQNNTDANWDVASKWANLWGAAGPFPDVNDARDGWRGTSPVRTYPPNAAGVYDTTGNVWEWQRGGKNKARIVRGASYVDSIAGDVNHAATLGARAVVHGTTTAGNIGFRCAKAVPKRVEHHWVWHDEEIHGQLTVEHEYDKKTNRPVQSDTLAMDDDDESGEDEFQAEKPVPRKKKKVVLKPERISTEL